MELTGALHDPKNISARLGFTNNVWMTNINGKVVYEDGHLTDVDGQNLAEKGDEVKKWLYAVRKQEPFF